MKSPKECIRESREIREKEGKQCLLTWDCTGNRHSPDCPCIKLAKKIQKESE